MLIKQILESAAVTGEIDAFHGGTKFDGPFDLNKSGTGEGMRVLGPGVYFSTDIDAAAKYAVRYAKGEPALYQCSVDVTDFHNFTVFDVPPQMLKKWDALAVELGYGSFGKIPAPTNATKNGWNQVGKVVEQLGDQGGRAMFIKHGIKGAVESVGGGGAFELCVFDLSTVTIHHRGPVDLEAM